MNFMKRKVPRPLIREIPLEIQEGIYLLLSPTLPKIFA